MTINEALKVLNEEHDFLSYARTKYGLKHLREDIFYLPVEVVSDTWEVAYGTAIPWYDHILLGIPIEIEASPDPSYWALDDCKFVLTFSITRKKEMEDLYGLDLVELIDLCDYMYYDIRQYRNESEIRKRLRQNSWYSYQIVNDYTFDFDAYVPHEGASVPFCRLFITVKGKGMGVSIYVCPAKHSCKLNVTLPTDFEDKKFPVNNKSLDNLITRLKENLDIKSYISESQVKEAVSSLKKDLDIGDLSSASFDVED